MELEAIIDGVGARLKALRSRRGTTLAQLAETTGISVSTLSRLESGQRKPTLELLLPLAAAHRVQLDELVAAPATGDPRVHMKPIQRHGTTYIPLSERPGGVRAFKQIIPAHHPAARPDLRTHEGYEWLYVLSGSLRLLLGEHEIDLGPGEAAEFDTRTPHAITNVGDVPVETINLFGPQGERLHVRASTGKRAAT